MAAVSTQTDGTPQAESRRFSSTSAMTPPALHRFAISDGHCKQCTRGMGIGSSTWARTRDLRINSPLLYQLSYRGMDVSKKCGSSTWARTRDPRINSPALYQLSYRGTNTMLVPRPRLELGRLSTLASETSASTNSATWAWINRTPTHASQKQFGGCCEIRTHGGYEPSLVFKTSALNRSAKHPKFLGSAHCDGTRTRTRCFPCFLARGLLPQQ